MSKKKKKRNKVYTGEDAAITKPVVTRISAVNRSPIKQWYFEHQELIKRILKVALILAIVIILIVEIINISSGSSI